MRGPFFSIWVLFVLLTAPASASETWLCTTHAQPLPGGTLASETPGHDQITLTDNDLIWTYGVSDTSPKRHYQLLVNNDVGAVAVFAQATNSPPPMKITGLPQQQADALIAQMNLPKFLVDGFIIALDKKGGVLRTGSVGSNGIFPNTFGECQRQAINSITPSPSVGAAPPISSQPH